MSEPSAEVTADRIRIRAITSLPEASGLLKSAIALALEGATIDESRAVLTMLAGAMSADEVAANINKRSMK